MEAINHGVYAARRQRLMDHYGEGVAIIVPSSRYQMRSRDTDFPFRQDSDFFYLTGFVEPDSWLVLRPGMDDQSQILFCRPRNRATEIWDGWRLGPERVASVLGISEAYSVDEFDQKIIELLAGCDALVVDFSKSEVMPKVQQWQKALQRKARQGVLAPKSIRDLTDVLHEHRLVKDAHEIAQMKRAADISVQAHQRAMQLVKPGCFEYELEAEFAHEFKRNGAHAPAYPSIVGSGANGVILHYVENNAQIQDGDLVLIDAGAEFEGYAADITRTFPANGRFSDEQRQLYEVVLRAQLAAIDACKPGNTFADPHDAAVFHLAEGLIQLGLLQGSVQSNIEDGLFKKYYMHRTGHWLGLDVHDVGRYKTDGAWRTLEPGMVLTVEPGLYVAEDDESVDERWRGIGIRIEDDVLITADGSDNLTAALPKSVDDIEALMR